MLGSLLGAVSDGIEQARSLITGQKPGDEGAEDLADDEVKMAVEELGVDSAESVVAPSSEPMPDVPGGAPKTDRDEKLARRVEKMMACLSLLGVETLPEVAMDEDPDNADALHALDQLLEKLDGLSKLLGEVIGTVDSVASLCEGDSDIAADAQTLWKEMEEQGIKPQGLSALLCRIAKKGSTAARAQGKERDQIAIQNGHAAAGLYLALMRLPGARSNLFSALPFHTIAMVLLHSEEAKQAKAKSMHGKRKPSSAPAGARKSKRGGAVKGQTGTQEGDDCDVDSESDDDEADSTKAPPSASQATATDSMRGCAMQQAVRLSAVLSFEGKEEAHVDLAQVAVETAMKEAPGRLQDAALECGRNLMLPLHGVGATASLSVLKQLIPLLLQSTPLHGAPRAAVALVRRALEAPADDEHAATICASTVVLIQNLAARVPDRAPVRAAAAATVRGLVEALATLGDISGCLELSRVARFLPRLAHHERFALRVFACEMAAELIPLWEDPGADAPQRNIPDELLPAIVRMLLRRACDKFPAVRAKALAALAAVLRSPTAARAWVAHQGTYVGTGASGTFNQSLSSQAGDLNMSGLSRRGSLQPGASPGAASAAPSAAATPSGSVSSTPGAAGNPALDASIVSASKLASDRSLLPNPDDPTSCCPLTSAALRRRVVDPKSVVRRAAVTLLEARVDLFVQLPIEFAHVDVEADLAALATRCRDASVLVRKQALDSVSGLVAGGAGEEAMHAWATRCLPLVRDAEPSVAERAIDTVGALVLEPLVARRHAMGAESARLLRLISDDALQHLQWTCKSLARRKPSGLPAGLLKALVGMLDAAAAAGTPLGAAEWVVLEEAAAAQPSTAHAGALVAAYDRAVGAGWDEQAGGAMRALRRLAPHLAAEDAVGLEDKLLAALARAGAPIALAGDMVRTAAALAQQRGTAGETWQAGVLAAAHERIVPLVQRRLAEGPGAVPRGPVREVVCAVFVIGELSLQQGSNGAKVSTKVANTLQALLTPTEARVPGALAPELLPEGEEELQGHVVLALGKLAVNDSALAAKVVPLFLRELERSPSAVRRNNILLALSDLCVRHTSLVDPHVPRLALCLRDANETVRRHALLVITTLLCSDYLKWRGSLFFRYLAATVDDSAAIREQARQNLFRVLLPKSNHQICHTNVVEALFVLNDVRHGAYNNFRASPEERARFSLAGPRNAARRSEILRLMISHCSDEQRVSVTGKISEDVLGATADGTLSLQDAADVVADALMLLAAKEMRLSSVQRRSGTVDEDAAEEDTAALSQGGGAKGLNAAARSKILGQVVRANLMRNLVPTLAALKHVLEQAHSPLLGGLMECLAAIAREYRGEMDDVLLSNKQLAAELAFDLRRVEPEDATPDRRRSSGARASIGSLGSAREVLLSPSADMRAKGKAATPISIPRLSLGGADTPSGMAEVPGRRATARNSLSSRNEEENDIAPPNFGAGDAKAPAALGTGGRESRALRRRQ